MKFSEFFNRRTLFAGVAVTAALLGAIGYGVASYARGPQPDMNLARTTYADLKHTVRVGDVVFVRIGHAPFTYVADATNTWTNHVGVVVAAAPDEPRVAESRIPLSGDTSLENFVGRSELGRVAVRRLPVALDTAQQAAVVREAKLRYGKPYDTGFDLDSPRQFCSKFVREVLLDAAKVEVGEAETFSALLAKQPDADQGFWKKWFMGSIPWQRRTVTPASQLLSARLQTVFDGRVVTER